MGRPLLAASLLALALPLASAGRAPAGHEISWETDYAAALERAAAEERVVFVAVNMDGEAANERMAKDVYTDKKLGALAGATVNLVASPDAHKDAGICPRFGCASCEAHRKVDIRVREAVLAPDATGLVIAPQHVFLGPDGAVLLSVPYEVTSLELQWCFGEAWRLAGASDVPRVQDGAQRPRRLIVGGVAKVGDNGQAPMTREQALELIDKHKQGGDPDVRGAMMREIVLADEPEAVRYALDNLRSADSGKEVHRAELIRWMGAVSPASYREVIEPFVGSGVPSTRNEAIVALEQLGDPESLKVLLKLLKKEKDEALAKNLLRAVGACARGDKKARAALLSASEDTRRPLARRNALIALGWCEADEDVAERLRQAALPAEFGKKAKIGPDRITPLEREAAVVAMGLSRDRAWLELLARVQAEDGAPAELVDAAARAAEVIEGAPYHRLREALARAGGDEIPRDRLFPDLAARGGGGK